MKKVQVGIKNKTTLVLLEDAIKGDIIDLSEKIDIDASNLNSIITESIEKSNKKKIEDAIKEERIRNQKEKENEKDVLKAQMEAKFSKEIIELNEKIKELNLTKSQIEENNKAVIDNIKLNLENKYKDQINDLNLKIKDTETELLTKIKEVTSNYKEQISDLNAKAKEIESNYKDKINDLNLKIKDSKTESLTKVSEVEKEKETIIQGLNFELKRAKEELTNEINRKKTLSVKEIGEDLEVFCENRVNKILSYGGFPNASFEKDNTCIEGDDGKGKKGDYIFKEHNNDGIEFVSIMFEMKNEDPTSKNKHKNKDFFEKLDKDRERKKCRYAVLVSLLEADSELYNEGIVAINDYKNMYVIRPQFIVPFITFIRNNCLNNISYLKEIEDYKQSNIDVENFNKELGDFKASFGNNVRLAVEKFDKAIEDIDKTIKSLEKTKEDLTSSKRNLVIANNKVEDVTIRKLTKNSPSLKEAFKEAEEKKKDN